MGLQLLCGLLTASGPTDGNPINHKFHATVEKHTVLSASCAAIWDVSCELPSQVTIVAPASLLWPFMDHGARAAVSNSLLNQKQQASTQYLPHTSTPGNQINTTLHLPAADTASQKPTTGACTGTSKQKASVNRGNDCALLCLPCNLQGYLILPAAAAALEELLSDVRCSAGNQTEWNYAWGLASVPSTQPATRVPAHQRIAHAITSALGGQQAPMPLPSSISACLAVLTCTISSPLQAAQAVQAIQKQAVQLMRRPAAAVLGCESLGEESALLPGRKVLVMGSPFGCLAPHHFANSCMQGIVSMIPDVSAGPNDSLAHGSVLFTLDAPCLPGMEGGLVHAGETGGAPCVLGMLCLPLSRASDGVQIQVALNMQYILKALTKCGQVPEQSLQPPQQQQQGAVALVSTQAAFVAPTLPAAHAQPRGGATLKDTTTCKSSSQSSAQAAPRPSPATPRVQQYTTQHQNAPSKEHTRASQLSVPASLGSSVAIHQQQLQAAPCSAACSVAQSMRGVVLVRTQHSWATGVIISPGGLVLTNAHLLLPGVASGQQARAALRHAASQYGHSLRHAEVLARADTHATVSSSSGTHGTESSSCTDNAAVFELDDSDPQPGSSSDGYRPRGIPIPRRSANSTHRQDEAWVSEQEDSIFGWHTEGGLERQLCRLNFRGGSCSPGSGGHGIARRHTSASCMLQLPESSSSAGSSDHGGIPHVQLLQPSMASSEHTRLTSLTHHTPHTTHIHRPSHTTADVTAVPCRHQVSSTAMPVASGSCSPGSERAAPARLRPASLAGPTGTALPRALTPKPGPTLQPAPACAYGSMPVYVVGHGLVGPAAGWPAAVTAGNVAQVVHAHGRPCMLITTATVHAGASGGAVLDASGRLVALVTSNARHASGHTLPNLNFCIPAEALQPVVAALLRHEQRRGDAAASHTHKDWTSSLDVLLDVHASRQLLREDLDALDVSDPEADRVWNLEGPPPAPPWPAAAPHTAPPAVTAPAYTASHSKL